MQNYDYIKERGFYCEYYKVNYWSELHHALIGRMKGVKELDLPQNIMCVCKTCHEKKIHGRVVKEWFWKIQVQRYGETAMRLWLQGLPLKIKPKF